MDRVSKGESFEDASKAVRKYLFDYTELAPFEQNVMKRILPFYTWSRKNIPLQISSLLKSPQKYARYGKAVRAFKDPETKKHYNRYLKMFLMPEKSIDTITDEVDVRLSLRYVPSKEVFLHSIVLQKYKLMRKRLKR